MARLINGGSSQPQDTHSLVRLGKSRERHAPCGCRNVNLDVFGEQLSRDELLGEDPIDPLILVSCPKCGASWRAEEEA